MALHADEEATVGAPEPIATIPDGLAAGDFQLGFRHAAEPTASVLLSN
jgi:hypothetical protein